MKKVLDLWNFVDKFWTSRHNA